MKVVVGSKNPTKINAVKEAFENYFDDVNVIGIKAESDVSDMPTNSIETLQGAINRAKKAIEFDNSDFGVGLEGGVEDTNYGMMLFGRIVIIDKNGNYGVSGTEGFMIPEKVAEKIRNGKELGPVLDAFLGESDTKKKQGAIGVFTKGHINRTDAFKAGVIMALVKFINPNWYDLK